MPPVPASWADFNKTPAPSPTCPRKLFAPPLSPTLVSWAPSRGAGPGPERPHLEDDDPGVADVVKIDGALVGVGAARAAHVVVAVPVDTEPAGVEVLAPSPEVVDIILGQAALAALLLERGNLMAAHDAIVPRKGADERHLIVLLRLVVGGQGHIPLSAHRRWWGIERRGGVTTRRSRKGRGNAVCQNCPNRSYRYLQAFAHIVPPPGTPFLPQGRKISH